MANVANDDVCPPLIIDYLPGSVTLSPTLSLMILRLFLLMHRDGNIHNFLRDQNHRECVFSTPDAVIAGEIP